MKIILINPPSPYLENDSAYPPSGLMYLASSIEQTGNEVNIVDLSGNLNWQQDIQSLDGDVFGITCSTPNFNIVKKIASLLPNKPIIIGGPHPTFLPKNTLDEINCDSIVLGEGEIIISEVMKDLENNILKKIYYGITVPPNLIPKPARHLVTLGKYRSTPIYTSRGCYYNCNFCSKICGNAFRQLPVRKILEEVEEVVKLGYRNIIFGDDNIALSKGLKELLERLMTFNISFRLNQDTRKVDRDILKLAKMAGCSEISFGIESGSQFILDKMNKRTTVENNEKAIKEIKDFEISTNAYFMVNFPGETQGTIEETLRFAERTKPDKWLLSAFAPLPGSDTYLHPEKYGITWISPNWDDFYLVGKNGGFSPCFETKELTRERQIFLHDYLRNGLKEVLK